MMLQGKKTYLTAAAAVLVAAASFLNGQIDLAALLQTVATALIGAFIRAGITTEGEKK